MGLDALLVLGGFAGSALGFVLTLLLPDAHHAREIVGMVIVATVAVLLLMFSGLNDAHVVYATLVAIVAVYAVGLYCALRSVDPKYRIRPFDDYERR